MTPAERIAAALFHTYGQQDTLRSLRIANAVLDALMDGHTDMHLHRHPDGTITAVPMEVAWIGPTDDWWRDTPGGAA